MEIYQYSYCNVSHFELFKVVSRIVAKDGVNIIKEACTLQLTLLLSSVDIFVLGPLAKAPLQLLDPPLYKLPCLVLL